ncbi:MAG: PHP domain-containing protein [Methylococcales symbiont of Hymedesmia sp. n. MRB-2018]|nr:MAG: PHP domain-containing protein [Methylococcales symbiont of Hymedesmia sp. n. MRB-2018]
MTERYDLHCHSMASDGSLTPTELISRAKEMGVTSLALTDHDTINGQQEAKVAARDHGINFIPGIEISTTWENKCFHIVGLNINPKHDELTHGIKKLQTLRAERAKTIAQKLEKKSISSSYEAVIKAAKGGMVTRAHFASYLLAQNYVSTQQEAFDRYLGKGKPAFVSTIWADLHDTINWINRAGGVAVVAHPLRYKMTASWMRRFLSFFKEAGGQGLEVVTGRSNPDEIRRTLNYAKQYDLAASVGSDFHTPDNPWVELGRLAPLPKNITAIWELF